MEKNPNRLILFQECHKGSVLGPIILVYYINNLPDVFHTNVKILQMIQLFTDVSLDGNNDEIQNDIIRFSNGQINGIYHSILANVK